MKANLKNTNINYHIVREDFSESDMDGNITINVSYINRRNMSAKEAREHIQQIKKYAEEHNLKNQFIIEDNNPESPMNFSKGLNEILAMIQALNEGKSNMRIARIIPIGMNNVEPMNAIAQSATHARSARTFLPRLRIEKINAFFSIFVNFISNVTIIRYI